MTRIVSEIDIAVPPALCISAIQSTLTDERLLRAYEALREGKEYSGYVTRLTPDREIVIAFAGLDPSTNKRMHSVGWKITYDFTRTDDRMTRVVVAVEYGLLTAIAGGGFTKVQAQNEIGHRLDALRMLEAGVLAGATTRAQEP